MVNSIVKMTKCLFKESQSAILQQYANGYNPNILKKLKTFLIKSQSMW
jgi:hypothetical protein